MPEPICDRSDLPTWMCDCCTTTPHQRRIGGLAVITINQAEHIAQKPLPQYRMHRRPIANYPAGTEAEWATGQPEVIRCNHPHPDGHICPACTDAFHQVLGDIPALVEDLEIAITKQTRFLEHGTRKGDTPRPDEAPVVFNPAASQALTGLTDALAYPGPTERATWGPAKASRWMLTAWSYHSRNPKIGDIIEAITRAVAKAHRVIDRPKDMWFYGACPTGCGHDLYDERGIQVVSCRHCDYQATIGDHQRTMLDLAEDRWMTAAELVGAFERWGEPITRQQLSHWTHREGLPREVRQVPCINRAGQLTVEDVYVYRVGDVRNMIITMEARRGTAS